MFGSGFYLLLNLNYLTVQVTLQHLETMQCNWLVYIYMYMCIYICTYIQHIHICICVYVYLIFYLVFLIFLHQICTRMTCLVGVIGNVLANTVKRL